MYSPNEGQKSNQVTVYGLTGIVNTSNTCYMNSAIQALSHIYPLTHYFFSEKEQILKVLKKNAPKILKDSEAFKLTSNNTIPLELKNKIQDPNYKPEMLTQEEERIVYNSTITAQLIKLLEGMWSKNGIVIPTSFRRIFSEARNKFFFGYEQHDSEEAYSCILQKMQEELAEKKGIKFQNINPKVQEFIDFKNHISNQISKETSTEGKNKWINLYAQKKKEMPMEALTLEAFREMEKYYGNTYSRITEIFSGFLHSSITCPDSQCKYASNKFDPFLHLSLPIPNNPGMLIMPLNIEDCMKEYCREEILDEQNLWMCEGCKKKVNGIKKLQILTPPLVLAFQLKRFGDARRSKDSRLIKYPIENLDISSLISPIKFNPLGCYKYKLQSVINHTGGLNNGHYFTYCKDEDSGK